MTDGLPQSSSRSPVAHGAARVRSADQATSPRTGAWTCRRAERWPPPSRNARSLYFSRRASAAYTAPSETLRARGLFHELLHRDGVGVIAQSTHRQEREFLELAESLALHGAIDITVSSLLYR